MLKDLRNLNAEFRLLLDSIPYPLRPEEIERLRQDITPGLDWQIFSTLIGRHQVGSLVYHNFKQCAQDLVPSSTMDELKTRHERHSQIAMALSVELAGTARRLASQGISICPLKGILLSQQLYGSPNLRDAGDIDILIPFESVDQAEGLLFGLGYRRTEPTINLTRKQKQVYKQLKHHFGYMNPNGWTTLELHWLIGSIYHIPPEITSEMLARTQKITFLGVPVLTLTREDTLAFMIYHGSQHGWSRLKWLADLAVFLRQDTPTDWNEVMAVITKMGIQQSFAESFIFAEQLLGSTIPEPVREFISRQPAAVYLGNLWVSALLSKTHPELFRFRQGLYALRFPSGKQSKIQRFCGLFLDPNDWRDIPLPDRLFGLYYLLRPFIWTYRKIIPFKPNTRLS